MNASQGFGDRSVDTRRLNDHYFRLVNSALNGDDFLIYDGSGHKYNVLQELRKLGDEYKGTSAPPEKRKSKLISDFIKAREFVESSAEKVLPVDDEFDVTDKNARMSAREKIWGSARQTKALDSYSDAEDCLFSDKKDYEKAQKKFYEAARELEALGETEKAKSVYGKVMFCKMMGEKNYDDALETINTQKDTSYFNLILDGMSRKIEREEKEPENTTHVDADKKKPTKEELMGKLHTGLVNYMEKRKGESKNEYVKKDPVTKSIERHKRKMEKREKYSSGHFQPKRYSFPEVKVKYLGGPDKPDFPRINLNLLKPKFKLYGMFSGFFSNENRINLLRPRIEKGTPYSIIFMLDFINAEELPKVVENMKHWDEKEGKEVDLGNWIIGL